MPNPLKNLAQNSPSAFDIFPTNENQIKLFGWLRAYADFPIISEQRNYPSADFNSQGVTYTDIILEIYEACSTGQWLAVETYHDRNKAKFPCKRTRVSLVNDKQELATFFRARTPYVREVLNAVGIEYVTVVGKEG